MTDPYVEASHDTRTFSLTETALMVPPDANERGIVVAPAPETAYLQRQHDPALGSEERLAAAQGPGVAVAGTEAGNTRKQGLISPRLLLPGDAGFDVAGVLHALRDDGRVTRYGSNLLDALTAMQERSGTAARVSDFSSASARLNQQTGGPGALADASSVVDVLLWLKRAMAAGAFAAAAPLVEGPGAALPDAPDTALRNSTYGFGDNKRSRPGEYAAYRRAVDDLFAGQYLSEFEKEYWIDRMMNPEEYASSGGAEDRNWLERNWDDFVDTVKKPFVWGKKQLTQGIKFATDKLIEYNPIVLTVGAIDGQSGREFTNWLINRKDKFGGAVNDIADGIGHMVQNPVATSIGMARLASGNPWAWEQVADSIYKAFQDDPEKATYRTAIELLLLRGPIKSVMKGDGATAGRAGAEGGSAGRAAESTAGKTRANPLESRSQPKPTEPAMNGKTPKPELGANQPKEHTTKPKTGGCFVGGTEVYIGEDVQEPHGIELGGAVAYEPEADTRELSEDLVVAAVLFGVALGVWRHNKQKRVEGNSSDDGENR